MLNWISRSTQGQGNQIYVSFPLRGMSIKGADRACPCPSLHVLPNGLRAHTVTERWDAATPVSYGLPGILVAMGMSSFKLWQASVLSRHPGGLAAPIHAAFPPRRELRGVCVGDNRRGWRYKLRRLGLVLGSPAQF